jgi:4-amino-4-deoxy-L-arabinose transferase-like glycosyltransferase
MPPSDQRAPNRSLLGFLISLVWLMLVVAFYFVVHKPADNDQLTALAGWLSTLLIGAILFVAAASISYRLLNGWGTPDLRAMLAPGLGLGLISLAALALGAIGAVRTEIGWLVVAALAVIGGRSFRAWWHDLRETINALAPTTRFARLALVYCGFVLTVALLQSLAPPTAWDGLAYHLVGPELYLANGQITHPLDLPYLGFPQFGEMLFLFQRLLGGQWSGVMHWIFTLMTTLLVASEAQRVWSKNIGWIAAAIFLSAETIVLEAGWPYVDLMLAFFSLAAFMCLCQWQIDRTRRGLILAAVFVGLAMATKYSSAPIIVGLALIVVIRSDPDKLRSLGIFSAVAALVALPWYLKSWLLLGNPFYPFVFGGAFWDSVRAESFGRPATGFLFTAPWRLLTAPWDATIWGVEAKQGYSATIGPLFLMLVPITLLAWRKFDAGVRRVLSDAVLVCAVTYISWLIGMAASNTLVQSRLLLPVFPLFAIIAAGAFEVLRGFDRPSLSLQRLGIVLVSIALIATSLKIGLDFGRSEVLPVLSGAETPDQYLTDRLGWYYPVMQALNELGPQASILFLWEPRSFYCRVDCRPDAMIDQWWHARRTIGALDQIAAHWQQAGVQYVLINTIGYRAALETNLDQSTPEDQQALDRFIAYYLDLVQDYGGAYQLYRWRATDSYSRWYNRPTVW